MTVRRLFGFDWKHQTPNAFFPDELVFDVVCLRPPKTSDHKAWAALRRESRSDLVLWEDDWAPSALDHKVYKKRLRLYDAAARRRVGLSLFIFDSDADLLVGGITLSNLRFGAACAGVLGYWIGSAHHRKGYGAAAVTCLTSYAFDMMGLNRIEAACDPENAASCSLLKRCGYEHEGRAKDYLKINGYWRDHDIYAAVATRWTQAQRTG